MENPGIDIAESGSISIEKKTLPSSRAGIGDPGDQEIAEAVEYAKRSRYRHIRAISDQEAEAYVDKIFESINGNLK